MLMLLSSPYLNMLFAIFSRLLQNKYEADEWNGCALVCSASRIHEHCTGVLLLLRRAARSSSPADATMLLACLAKFYLCRKERHALGLL